MKWASTSRLLPGRRPGVSSSLRCPRGAADEMWMSEVLREGLPPLPELTRREQASPWAARSLSESESTPPGGGRGSGCACERAAGSGIGRGLTASGTAGMPTACERSGGGRRRSGSSAAAGERRAGGVTASESAGGAGSATRSRRRRRVRVVTQGRHGAAIRSAPDPGAMGPPRSRFAPRRATAGATAGWRSAASSTASGSGGGERGSRGDSSARASTRTGSPAVPGRVSRVKATHREGRRPLRSIR
jgi:hypothetical protein